MKPFFSYYGSKYRLSQSGFYPAPKHNIVIEPFAGSACYSIVQEVEEAILIDKSKDIIELWNFLINAQEQDIKDLPTEFDETEFNQLPIGARNLIGFWIKKAAYSPAKLPTSWYSKYRLSNTCRVWSGAVKKRIIKQLPKIRGWKAYCSDYSVVKKYQNTTIFIDPPYSGRAGRRYPHNFVDYQRLQSLCSELSKNNQVICCENEDLTIRWANFNSTALNASMRRTSKKELCATNGMESK